MIHQLLTGFGNALSWENFLAALAGAFIGTAIGVLPGMSPTVAIALLLVPTLKMPGESGLVLLSAVFFGTQYGDSVTAILLDVPSEPASIVIALDGYPMTKKGRHGPALALAAFGSFCGAVIGLAGLALFAHTFSKYVFQFGPVEIAALAGCGLLILVRASGTRLAAGLVALGLGLVLPTIGLDPALGTTRFTFGWTVLYQGLDLIPVALGLVGVAELIENALDPTRLRHRGGKVPLRSLVPARAEIREAAGASVRGGVLGFLLGLLPGPTLTMSSFASYRLERLLSRHPERFGHGAVAGVAGPKAADDAAVSGNLASLLTLGIPFSPVTGVLYAGFILHGITPGPLFIQSSPDLFWGLIAAMLVGNVALLVLNVPFISIWIWLIRIPTRILSVILALFILIGSFSVRNSQWDMLVTLMAGVLGVLLRRAGIDRTVVLVALILGPVLEENFRESMSASGGHLSIFLSRPISLVIVSITVGILIASAAFQILGRLGALPRQRLADGA